MKNRLLRHLLVFAVVLVFTGYFAFQTLLFPPIEKPFGPDLSTLVPDQVDFFVAKADLSRDFAPFPTLAVIPKLEQTKAWRTFERSPEYDELMAQVGLRAVLAEVEEALAALPSLPGLRVPAVFGGKDLALTGRFSEGDLASADWVVYGRTNFWGKLGASLLKHPGWIGLEKQGIAAHVGENIVTLEGGGLQRPLHVTREKDVVVVGTAQDIVEAVAELAVRGGQESFGQSARYFDYIQNSLLKRDGNEIEVFVKTRAMLDSMRTGGRWPDPDAEDFLPSFLSKLFQIGLVNEVSGIVDFESGLQLELTAELSSELMTPPQERLYRARGFEHRELFDAAELASSDSAVLVYVATNIGELLRQVFTSLEPDTRELIEDALRSMGRFQDANELITELDTAFRDRAAVIIRPNDFDYNYQGPLEEQDPPHDGIPVPAVAIVFWTKGDEAARKKIDDIHQLIARNQAKIGIEGRNPGDRGVFTNVLTGGYQVWEFWSKVIPGTGHLSAGEALDLYILSNSYKMVEHVIFTSFGDRPQLSEAPAFRALVSSGQPNANLAFWLNPRELAPLRRELSVVQAESEVRGQVVWEIERPRIEREVLAERYGSKGRSQLAPAEQQALDVAVSGRLDEWLDELLREQVPLLRAAYEREIIYSEAVAGVLGMLSASPRRLALSFRAVVPLDE